MPPQTNPTSTPITLEPSKNSGRFEKSRQIVKESWAILQKDKEIVWFPVLSMFVSSLLTGAAFLILFFTALNGNINEIENFSTESLGAVGYAGLFIYYIILFFIINFFQTGILVIVDGRFNGKDLDFKDGINGALNNGGKLLGWSIISATAGVVLNALENNSKIIGKVVGWVLGTAWAVLTYFSLPSLIIGKKSVKESFKESSSLIKTTWGEVFVINFGVGLFFIILILGTVTLGGILIAMISVLYFQILISILVALFILVSVIVSSALGTIFKLALYEYARTGKVIEGFSPELVKNAVKTSKK